MSDQRFKTMRHIETVRNYLNGAIGSLLVRGEIHDQSKLQAPEREIFDEYTQKLRGVTYGSDEYKAMMKEMQVAIDHHNANNIHHPEHYPNGIKDMSLLDLVEMLCDWKAATLRHNDGDILRSIDLNQKRFGYSDELAQIFRNTVKEIDSWNVNHKADES
jgi:hypothetical protein